MVVLLDLLIYLNVYWMVLAYSLRSVKRNINSLTGMRLKIYFLRIINEHERLCSYFITYRQLAQLTTSIWSHFSQNLKI